MWRKFYFNSKTFAPFFDLPSYLAADCEEVKKTFIYLLMSKMKISEKWDVK